MERVVLRHLSGSKSNQVEEFPIVHFPEIIVGRDPAATVKYDPEHDDLVGRQHAKIVVSAAAPHEFKILDLGSRNGTYVNGQRIFSETRISPGDVVQFGPGGPQLQFDVEPRPPATVPATRIAVDAPPATSVPTPATREAYTGGAASSIRYPMAPQKSGLGKETVERMITESNMRTRRTVVFGGAAIGAAGLVGAAVLYRRKSAPVVLPPAARKDANAAEIFKTHGQAVVFIHAAWKLVDIDTGRQVYHLYMENRNADGKPIINGPARLPVFIQQRDVIEPVLIDNDNQGRNRSIGTTHSASGFVIHQDGFILTNRHVAATWQTSYDWSPDEKFPIAPGLLIDLNQGKPVPLPEHNLPRRWVPASSKRVVMHGKPSVDELARLFAKQSPDRALEGRHDFLNVTFPETSVRIPARLARTSNSHDVALIKIDITEALHTLEMDDRQEVKAGDPVVVLGYPAVSLNRVASIQSRDNLKPEAERIEVPGLTVSTGNIGKIMMDDVTRASVRDLVVNPLGEYYQLTVNSAGAGNSGGPVFDTNGKVIGIFSASLRRDVMVSLAVPIKYGTELTKVSKVAG
jgi:serine protease Do